jgi:transglutaminase/protease-like cytokinesis protein 3
MKYITNKIWLLAIVFCTTTSFAQKTGKDFKAIDEYVKKLGSLPNLNMGTISSLLTKNYTDKTDKARAIFTWIATNISFDLKAAKNNSTDKNAPTIVLKNRMATGEGYASLYQDMCSNAGIRCLTANGFIKFNAEQINDTKTEINHSWAVVQLGQSPEAWYYVDACRGSGYADGEFKTFTKAFNPDYFFADLTIFNWQHYPDNIVWQLGPGPKNKKDFFGMPIIKSAAYEFGLKKFTPNDGSVKTKVDKALGFYYQVNGNTTIEKVAIVIGEGKKKKTIQVPFTFKSNIVGFTYTFKDEDIMPVMVLINGKEVIEYMVEVE